MHTAWTKTNEDVRPDIGNIALKGCDEFAHDRFKKWIEAFTKFVMKAQEGFLTEALASLLMSHVRHVFFVEH